MLAALGARAQRWAEVGTPWTNVYGIARTLIALSSALTLTFNDSTTLWRPIAGVVTRPPFCTVNTVQKGALYCLMPTHLDLARWIAIGILLLAASGWQPRITGVLHWWIAVSYQLTASTLEGGDQAAAALTLLLVPVTLTDPRSWHWQRAPIFSNQTGGRAFLHSMRTLVALSALLVARIQVCGIYFHSSFGKMQGTELNGPTARLCTIGYRTRLSAQRMCGPPYCGRSSVILLYSPASPGARSWSNCYCSWA